MVRKLRKRRAGKQSKAIDLISPISHDQGIMYAQSRERTRSCYHSDADAPSKSVGFPPCEPLGSLPRYAAFPTKIMFLFFIFSFSSAHNARFASRFVVGNAAMCVCEGALRGGNESALQTGIRGGVQFLPFRDSDDGIICCPAHMVLLLSLSPFFFHSLGNQDT